MSPRNRLGPSSICFAALLSGAPLLGVMAGCDDASGGGGSIATQVPLPPRIDGAGLDPDVLATVEQARAVAVARPSDAGPRFELAMALDANALHEAAAQVYGQAAALDPQHTRAHYHRARMLHQLGRPEEAREHLEKALKLDPGYAPAHRLSASWHLQSGDLAAAQTAFERVVRLEPDWPDGAVGLAQVALLREEPGRTEGLVRDVLQDHPDHAYAQHLLGSALRDQARLEEAQQAFALSAGSAPIWQDPWLEQVAAQLGGINRLLAEAKTYLEGGLFEQASQSLAVLHKRAPDDVSIQGMWTAALTRLARYDEALELLLAARERQPDHFRIELNLALVRWKQGDLDLALDHVQRSIAKNPNHKAIYMVQGQVLSDRRDLHGALGAFQRALELGEEPVRVLPRIGKLQVDLQRWDAATKTYGRAAKLLANDAAIHATLAGCFMETGDFAAAKLALARARSLDPALPLVGMIDSRLTELDPEKQP